MSTLASTSKTYFFQFDLVRCLAILAVIAIHVFYPVYARTDFIGGVSWWYAFVVNTLSRTGVPLFLLLSGALLLAHPHNTQPKVILSKTFWRIIVPLCIWFGIYAWWEVQHGSKMNPQILAVMIGSGSLYHLYFLVILFPLYLLAPGFTRIFQSKQSGQKNESLSTPVLSTSRLSASLLPTYVLVLAFSAEFIIGLLEYFVFKNTTVLNVLTLWVPYAGYFLFGYLTTLIRFNQKQLRWCAGIFVASTFITFVLGMNSLKQLSVGDQTFWKVGGLEYFTDYVSPNVTVAALSLFVLLTQGRPLFKSWAFKAMGSGISKEMDSKIGKGVDRGVEKTLRYIIFHLARASFGMYIVHALVISLIDQIGYFVLLPQYGPLWWTITLKMIVVTIVSLFAVSVIRKIPVLKISVGER